MAFRFIAANDHPDHDTIAIATFRRRFLAEIEALFVQVLLLCRNSSSGRGGKDWTCARRSTNFLDRVKARRQPPCEVDVSRPTRGSSTILRGRDSSS